MYSKKIVLFFLTLIILLISCDDSNIEQSDLTNDVTSSYESIDIGFVKCTSYSAHVIEESSDFIEILFIDETGSDDFIENISYVELETENSLIEATTHKILNGSKVNHSLIRTLNVKYNILSTGTDYFKFIHLNMKNGDVLVFDVGDWSFEIIDSIPVKYYELGARSFYTNVVEDYRFEIENISNEVLYDLELYYNESQFGDISLLLKEGDSNVLETEDNKELIFINKEPLIVKDELFRIKPLLKFKIDEDIYFGKLFIVNYAGSFSEKIIMQVMKDGRHLGYNVK